MIQVRCHKYLLPDGRTLDILAEVIIEISKWLQLTSSAAEAGGYIIGYQHQKTGAIVIESVTTPKPKDVRSRTRCNLIDEGHFAHLERIKQTRSYYVGTWHTHPQSSPIPSGIDWNDWNATVRVNKTGCGYIFFLIAGTESFEIWAGDIKTRKIVRLVEWHMERGLYVEN